MAVTVSQFLVDLRSVGMLPTATGLSDALLLRHADMEIASRFVSLMRRVNEEYMVRRVDVQSVRGRVRMPARAVAGSVRHVQVRNGNGWETLPQLQMESSGDGGGSVAGFCFDASGVVLLPLGSDALVRLHYYVAPGELTNANCVGVDNVVSVSATTTVFSVDNTYDHSTYRRADIISVGGDGSPIVVDAYMNSTSPPFGYTIAADVLGVLDIGDRVCPTGKTDVIPLPVGLYPAVLNRTAARVLTSLGYHEDAQRQAEMAEISISEAIGLLSNRSLGNPKRPTGGMLSAIGAGRPLRGV